MGRKALAFGFATLLLCGSASAGDPAVPAPPQPIHPFVSWLDVVEPGTPIVIPGLVVVPLLRSDWNQEQLPDLRVGLRGVQASWLDLPSPGGDLYVRMQNLGDAPVEITVGEALLTPAGPSRIVTRAAWVAPHAATLVGVTQAALPAPAGPYTARGTGLTPREQELLETDRWGATVIARNTYFLVEPPRLADGSAAYLTDAFEVQTAAGMEALRALEASAVVGLMAFDDRGPAYARLYGGATQFRRNLAQLVPELLADAVQAVQVNRHPDSSSVPVRHAQVRALLGTLAAPGVARASFGGCTLHRWLTLSRNGRWEGLSVDGKPVSLTWRHKPPPLPAQPPPPGAPPTPPPPQPPPAPPATPNQVARDPRPTVEDARHAELRTGAAGGASSGTPPSAPSPSPAAGGSGGGAGGGGGLGGGGGGGGLR